MATKKPLEDYPGYLIDTEGNVYSTRPSPRGSKDGQPHKLALKSNKGLLRVRLTGSDGRPVMAYIARLVLETFRGAEPNINSSPAYKDGNPSNCQLRNLEWKRGQNKKEHVSVKQFIRAWQTAPSMDELLATTGMTRQAASRRAKVYREYGVPLKELPEHKPVDWDKMAGYAKRLVEGKE
jgi:hypothetical protein